MEPSRQRVSVSVPALCILSTAVLTACMTTGAPAYVEPSRVTGHLLAVQSEPPAPVNIRPAPVGEIVLTEHGCFALRSRPGTPDLVIWAPYGASITPDGQGFTYKDNTLYLGDELSGFSGSFRGFATIENPSASWRECRPKEVVELW